MAGEAQSAVTLRRTGSTTMPDPRSSRMIWIGAWGALFGAVVYSLAQTDEMLPINRILFGVDSTLMLIWLLVILFDGPGRQS
ncbi:hypothetical protein SAMN05216360_12919 [Methylobacterium phyllostachyos]|uniref:Uncharacterized protein n=1 Tax=Methylobacterium phyllostachyos TaxID=582672 RepID=A0A1H0KUA5_9HYPH|nr:hypothetical protein [Methylobacterium phyllostachyos]SDO59547.1 hypothetical protein SAMN05216360_12919 [Methylobacterium phyllostachyos]